MRAELGFVAVQLALVAAGGGLLRALFGPQPLWRVAGPAWLLGAAAVVPSLLILLVIGIPLSAPLVFVVALAIAAGGFAVGRRRHGEPAERRRPSGITLVVAGLATAWFGWVAVRFASVPAQIDDARIWSLKAAALFWFDGLDSPPFSDAAYDASHREYPLFQPVLQASLYRAMGEADVRAGHLELWLLVAAFAWTLAWLLDREGPWPAWAAPVALSFGVVPVVTNISLGYADVTSACLLAAGALFIGRWVQRGATPDAVAGGILLGAAASTKNEGLAGALIVIAVAGGAALAQRPRPALRGWVAAAALALSSAVPWRIWTAANGIAPADQPGLGDALDPSYLADRADRAGTAAEVILDYVTGPAWQLVLAALLAVAIALWAGRIARPLAVFYALAALGLLVSIDLAYWTSTLPIDFHLSTSADRTVTGPMLVAAAGLGHLLALGARLDSRLATPT